MNGKSVIGKWFEVATLREVLPNTQGTDACFYMPERVSWRGEAGRAGQGVHDGVCSLWKWEGMCPKKEERAMCPLW